MSVFKGSRIMGYIYKNLRTIPNNFHATTNSSSLQGCRKWRESSNAYPSFFQLINCSNCKRTVCRLVFTIKWNWNMHVLRIFCDNTNSSVLFSIRSTTKSCTKFNILCNNFEPQYPVISLLHIVLSTPVTSVSLMGTNCRNGGF